jgi:hypothetical protein
MNGTNGQHPEDASFLGCRVAVDTSLVTLMTAGVKSGADARSVYLALRSRAVEVRSTAANCLLIARRVSFMPHGGITLDTLRPIPQHWNKPCLCSKCRLPPVVALSSAASCGAPFARPQRLEAHDATDLAAGAANCRCSASGAVSDGAEHHQAAREIFKIWPISCDRGILTCEFPL